MLEEFEEDITFAALGITNLLLFLLPELARGISLALTLLLELLFRLLVSQLLLNLEHVLLLLLHLGRLLVELLLDLLEHSQSLVPATACCLNYSLEHGLELRTKGEEVLGNLCLWVEGHGSLSFTRVEIDGGVDKSLTVALVEQSLDLRGRVGETKHLLKLTQLHVPIEVLALLQDSDGQSSLDERSVARKPWALSDEGIKCSLALL